MCKTSGLFFKKFIVRILEAVHSPAETCFPCYRRRLPGCQGPDSQTGLSVLDVRPLLFYGNRCCGFVFGRYPEMLIRMAGVVTSRTVQILRLQGTTGIITCRILQSFWILRFIGLPSLQGWGNLKLEPRPPDFQTQPKTELLFLECVLCAPSVSLLDMEEPNTS